VPDPKICSVAPVGQRDKTEFDRRTCEISTLAQGRNHGPCGMTNGNLSSRGQPSEQERAGEGDVDYLERARLLLDTERLRLDRQKTALEFRLRRQELMNKRGKAWKELLSNPLTLAIVGGFITIMTTIMSNVLTTKATLQNEITRAELARQGAQQSLQADLIKKFVEGPKVDTVRENLRFLIDAGLLPDYADRIKTYLASNPGTAPQVTPTGAAPQTFTPKLNAVVVGVAKYHDARLALQYPAKDAQDFAEALHRQQGGLYQSVNVRLLTDEGATRGAVLSSLDWLAREATPFDTSILSLDGHGLADHEEFYFIPSDSDPVIPEITAVSGNTLRRMLSRISGHVLVLLDTSYSGAFQAPGPSDSRPSSDSKPSSNSTIVTPQTPKNESASQVGSKPSLDGEFSKLVNELASAETGVAVLGSTQRTEAGYEFTSLRNGAFTSVLLRGLSGAANRSADGAIRLDDLALVVSDEVKQITAGRQHPIFSRPKGINFPIFLAATNRQGETANIGQAKPAEGQR
jgi:uncharacterized caspase-like protein